jgi:hypothetical protein
VVAWARFCWYCWAGCLSERLVTHFPGDFQTVPWQICIKSWHSFCHCRDRRSWIWPGIEDVVAQGGGW